MITRLVQEYVSKYSPENWAQVEEFIKANFPNVPVYRVKYYSSLLMVDKLGECYMMVIYL
jgi:hypothetical protein